MILAILERFQRFRRGQVCSAEAALYAVASTVWVLVGGLVLTEATELAGLPHWPFGQAAAGLYAVYAGVCAWRCRQYVRPGSPPRPPPPEPPGDDDWPPYPPIRRMDRGEPAAKREMEMVE